MNSLLTPETKIKVSSTLDKSVNKKYLTDGSPETCWTSQQGTPQTIQFYFPTPVIPRRIMLTFQGGFVGTRCTIEAASRQGTDKLQVVWEVVTQIFPEDVNRQQSFELTPKTEGGVESLKLVIEESSDFFGRVTVYDLQLEGEVL